MYDVSICRLESEIEEARLKAKEEMMQSVQIAKEMIQQELTSQKEAYESKIKSLEAEVVSCHSIFIGNLTIKQNKSEGNETETLVCQDVFTVCYVVVSLFFSLPVLHTILVS